MSSTPNTSNKAKLTSKVVALLGYFVTWFVMFPIFVDEGFIYLNKEEYKYDDDKERFVILSDFGEYMLVNVK